MILLGTSAPSSSTLSCRRNNGLFTARHQENVGVCPFGKEALHVLPLSQTVHICGHEVAPRNRSRKES